MKILMILEGKFPPDERVEKEALTLIRAGHQVTVITPSLGLKSKTKNSYKDIQVLRIPSSVFMTKKVSVACLTLPFYFSYWKKQIESIMKEGKFDVLHVHDLPLSKLALNIGKKLSV